MVPPPLPQCSYWEPQRAAEFGNKLRTPRRRATHLQCTEKCLKCINIYRAGYMNIFVARRYQGASAGGAAPWRMLPSDSEMFEHIRRRMALSISLIALLVVTGCLPDTERTGARRVDIGEPPTTAPQTELDNRLFPGFEVASEVRIDSTPFAIGDTFVGSVFPHEGNSQLSFYGFNATGTIWRVDTNPSCVGTVPIRVGDEAAIVILDSDARKDGRGKVSTTVATAFSAADAKPLWGPTEVPGPSPGSGLIFANTPKALTNERTPATLLDAASGVVVGEPAGMALYEHHGTALQGTAESFTAIDTSSGDTLWSSTQLSPGFIDVNAGSSARYDGDYGPATGNILILNWTDSAGQSVAVLHDFRTGAALGQVDGIPSGEATVDDATQTVLLTSQRANGAYRITAVRAGKGVIWTKDSDSPAATTAAGAGVAYARVDGQSVKIDLQSGKTLTSGEYALPIAVLPDGTALFPTNQDGTYAVAHTAGSP